VLISFEFSDVGGDACRYLEESAGLKHGISSGLESDLHRGVFHVHVAVECWAMEMY
jgi:hypothetical protein